MKTNTVSVNYKLAMTGLFAALSVILYITPIGNIQVGPLAITTMHVPVILATILAGLVPGLATGFIFGLTSFIRSLLMGNLFFANPLIAIPPRLLIPVVTFAVFRLLLLIPHIPKTVAGALSAAFGTLTNTVFVMLFIYVVYGKTLLESLASKLLSAGYDINALSGIKGYGAILLVTISTNGIWEILAAMVLTAAVLAGIYGASKKRAKLRAIKEE